MIRVAINLPSLPHVDIEHHRWRSAIREPRFLAQRHWYVMVGAIATANGSVATEAVS